MMRDDEKIVREATPNAVGVLITLCAIVAVLLPVLSGPRPGWEAPIAVLLLVAAVALSVFSVLLYRQGTAVPLSTAAWFEPYVALCTLFAYFLSLYLLWLHSEFYRLNERGSRSIKLFRNDRRWLAEFQQNQQVTAVQLVTSSDDAIEAAATWLQLTPTAIWQRMRRRRRLFPWLPRVAP